MAQGLGQVVDRVEAIGPALRRAVEAALNRQVEGEGGPASAASRLEKEFGCDRYGISPGRADLTTTICAWPIRWVNAILWLSLAPGKRRPCRRTHDVGTRLCDGLVRSDRSRHVVTFTARATIGSAPEKARHMRFQFNAYPSPDEEEAVSYTHLTLPTTPYV